ncbi:MAG: zf-HC2 domain-containing protein [Treponema sp.]|nr:zf-HC2 domain-containing protein [Treponema sp.]
MNIIRCPDRQLLSIYFDGELSSPWKEKMEEHIAACAPCRTQLESYKKISIGFSAKEEEILHKTQERVWQKLEQERYAFSRRMPAVKIWRRHISVPIPAAAAIALMFISLALFSVFWTANSSEMPGTVIASETDYDLPVIVSIDEDFEDVLRFLSSSEKGEVIFLQMPDNRNFEKFSEPSIIKAADYSRQTPRQDRPGGNMNSRSNR